jgi:hypothetical protein
MGVRVEEKALSVMNPPAPGPGAAATVHRDDKITREVVLAAALDIVDRDGVRSCR